MSNELQKAAEEHYIKMFGVCPTIEKSISLHSYLDMINFATSFYQRQIIQAQIDVLRRLIYSDKEILKMNNKIQSVAVINNVRVKNLINELQTKLNESK